MEALVMEQRDWVCIIIISWNVELPTGRLFSHTLMSET